MNITCVCAFRTRRRRTLACGTGACAAVVAGILRDSVARRWRVVREPAAAS